MVVHSHSGSPVTSSVQYTSYLSPKPPSLGTWASVAVDVTSPLACAPWLRHCLCVLHRSHGLPSPLRKVNRSHGLPFPLSKLKCLFFFSILLIPIRSPLFSKVKYILIRLEVWKFLSASWNWSLTQGSRSETSRPRPRLRTIASVDSVYRSRVVGQLP